MTERARPRRVPRAALASALALFGALALWRLWPAGAPPEPPPPPKPGPAKAAPAGEAAAPRAREGRAQAPPGAPPEAERPYDEQGVARQAKRFDALDHAIELTRFPPDSRPLTAEMTDVLRPNRRHEQPQPLAAAHARGQKVDPERDLFVLFTGPRFALTPGEPLAATLEVTRGRPDEGRGAERVALEVRECVLRASGPAPLAEGLPLNDRGEHGDPKAGDLSYSLSVDPLTLAGFERYNGPARLEVAFVAPGASELAHASLDFKLGAVTPARFNGRVAERLAPAGLELRVGLDVEQPGHYVVQGLLFDARDQPVGFAVDRPTLGRGAGEATLLFFGLLFHEADARAPFVLRTVTGYRLPEGDEPDKLEMAPMPGEYRTHAYPRSAFSADEWQSASKDKRLEALRELAEKNPDKALVSGTPESPQPAPAPSP
ncbi:MAG TPA: hypothetical protein VFS43_46085 [Polyangiaceae bacterium]|nr:hypothetical protein [Polyangiaceae bacterium]